MWRYGSVYGAVTMNNTMCLGLFMLVIHAQGLEWTFTSETLTILLATFVVGAVVGGLYKLNPVDP